MRVASTAILSALLLAPAAWALEKFEKTVSTKSSTSDVLEVLIGASINVYEPGSTISSLDAGSGTTFRVLSTTNLAVSDTVETGGFSATILTIPDATTITVDSSFTRSEGDRLLRTSSLVALFEEDGVTSITQPAIADGNGNVRFYWNEVTSPIIDIKYVLGSVTVVERDYPGRSRTDQIQVVDGAVNLTIQAAIDALPAGGGTVYVPPGNRTISAQINISKPVHLIHEGGTWTGPFADDVAVIKVTSSDVTITCRNGGTIAANGNMVATRDRGRHFLVWVLDTTAAVDNFLIEGCKLRQTVNNWCVKDAACAVGNGQCDNNSTVPLAACTSDATCTGGTCICNCLTWAGCVMVGGIDSDGSGEFGFTNIQIESNDFKTIGPTPQRYCTDDGYETCLTNATCPGADGNCGFVSAEKLYGLHLYGVRDLEPILEPSIYGFTVSDNYWVGSHGRSLQVFSSSNGSVLRNRLYNTQPLGDDSTGPLTVNAASIRVIGGGDNITIAVNQVVLASNSLGTGIYVSGGNALAGFIDNDYSENIVIEDNIVTRTSSSADTSAGIYLPNGLRNVQVSNNIVTSTRGLANSYGIFADDTTESLGLPNENIRITENKVEGWGHQIRAVSTDADDGAWNIQILDNHTSLGWKCVGGTNDQKHCNPGGSSDIQLCVGGGGVCTALGTIHISAPATALTRGNTSQASDGVWNPMSSTGDLEARTISAVDAADQTQIMRLRFGDIVLQGSETINACGTAGRGETNFITFIDRDDGPAILGGWCSQTGNGGIFTVTDSDRVLDGQLLIGIAALDQARWESVSGDITLVNTGAMTVTGRTCGTASIDFAALVADTQSTASATATGVNIGDACSCSVAGGTFGVDDMVMEGCYADAADSITFLAYSDASTADPPATNVFYCCQDPTP